jgi:hypothetical protein
MAETPASGDDGHTPESKPAIPTSAVVATVLGNALEFYDFTTYAFFAVMIGRAFFPSHDPFISLLLYVTAFGVGFITRPLGGIVIGAYADRAGRRPAMMLSIGLMAVGMVLLAAAPSYATIGLAAPFLVVFARLVQGFALAARSDRPLPIFWKRRPRESVGSTEPGRLRARERPRRSRDRLECCCHGCSMPTRCSHGAGASRSSSGSRSCRWD